MRTLKFSDGSTIQLGQTALDRVQGWLAEEYHVVQFTCKQCGWSGTVQLGHMDYEEVKRQRFQFECAACGDTHSPVRLDREITRGMLEGNFNVHT